MKKLVIVLFLYSPMLLAYHAEIRKLNAKDKTVLFTLVEDEKIEAGIKTVNAQFKAGDQVAVDQTAQIDAKTGELINAAIDQKQSNEKGTTEVEGTQVKVTYRGGGKAIKKKELKKPENFVTPANFDEWLAVHFEEIKKTKTLTINFFVWDRMETYKFKITYLGIVDLAGVKAQNFKLNIDNAMLAAFISPIKIWKSEDMKTMLKFEGQVAVKQVKGRGLENFDAEVLYFQDLKAAQ